MFQKFSVRTRIIGGSVVVILVMSLVAVIGLAVVSSLSTIFDAYESGASGNGGMALQLPLNHAHLGFMEQTITAIVRRAA